MNNKIKNIMVFAFGVGVGATGAYFYIREKFARLANEEIASVREIVTRRYPPSLRADADVDGDIVLNGDKVLVMGKDRYKRIVRNYHAISSSDSDPENAYVDEDELENHVEADENSYEEMSDESNRPKSAYDTPHIISLEEFAEEMTNFDKLTINYYDDDGVLVDDGEEIIVDVNGTIGEESLNSFGMLSDDPDIVYIRNDKLETDYEVIRLPKSYSETVLGYKNTEGRGHRTQRGGDYES